MSLITLVGTHNFISVMSDGRLYDSGKEAVVKEDYEKISKVTNNIIIGATGSHLQARSLLEIAPYWAQKAENDIEVFTNYIRNRVLEDIPKSKHPNKVLHIVIAGINKTNDLILFTFTNDESTKLERYLLKTLRSPVYLALGKAGAIDILKQHVISNSININNVKEAQIITNEKISLADITVNTETFHEYIEVSR